MSMDEEKKDLMDKIRHSIGQVFLNLFILGLAAMVLLSVAAHVYKEWQAFQTVVQEAPKDIKDR